MNTTTVHKDYARERIAGQHHRFGTWARATVKALISIAPKIAADIDLSCMPDCDHLWIHYEAKRSPAEAALEAAAGRWR